TATVQLAPFAPTVRAVGAVVASPRGYAELSAPTASRVTHVFVVAGQSVRAGEALVELDAAPLAAAASGATAARDAAQQAYDRAARLSAEGILPRKAVDQARADLAQANAAAVAARHTFSLSTLHAPISGAVTRMSAVTGASADPSQVLVAVADPKALQVLLQVSPADAASVRPGAAVTFYDSDAPGAASIGRGTVATVGAALDTASRSVPVRATIGSTSRAFRLGETITGRVALPGTASAMAIPVAALVPDSAGTYKVYVVANGVAHATPVEVGTRGDSVIEITKGLKPGETVVTTGAYGLEDSSKVTVPRR
ncbi:MAG TPA: efflux RND transporter periplasmic adaptor subunit, partial [Candidatus Elarobacter sp.]|nr:efflux RND transporter periplasmic adaptor subunit [Candidatus Elarobacter sp.]